MWGVGCVFFEIVSLFPLFPGTVLPLLSLPCPPAQCALANMQIPLLDNVLTVLSKCCRQQWDVKVTEVVNLSVSLLFPCLVCITWFCYHEPHSSLHYAKNECTHNVRLKCGKKCAQAVSTCGFQIPTSGWDRNRTTHPTCFSSMRGVAQQVACIQSWWPVGTLFVYYVYVHNGCSELQKPFKNWEIVRHWILTNKFFDEYLKNLVWVCVCVCVFLGGPLRLSARQALRHGYFKDLVVCILKASAKVIAACLWKNNQQSL
jgi:hypothetical protein